MRVVGLILLAVVVLIGAATGYFFLHYPNVAGPSQLAIDRTTDRLLRGGYLVNNVMGCRGCHSVGDHTLVADPPVPETQFGGGREFHRGEGVPGVVYSRNITQGALREWTDGELLRAVTAGVSKDGRALFPIMPYAAYGTLERDDLYSVIAYLRTIPTVKNVPPDNQLDFPVNLIVRTLPHDAQFVQRPPSKEAIAYGKYMVTAAGCGNCHTKMDERGNVIGVPFAGGREFNEPGRFLVRSANITPDNETGIGKWTREQFIARFKSNTEEDYRKMKVAPGQPNTVMPWWEFSGMTEFDLGTIYDYLRSIQPSRNAVEKFAAAR